ncbi:MAG: heat-inducible transcription repressor HrcA [Dehalococcoidia bacterium]|nr:heat-inducible transcription repressor HrcA [Dehalococcoidia bacterium]RLC63612.1 MAG: heat-inducible transcription repressor HrcA [Chloroflexota bacterium]
MDVRERRETVLRAIIEDYITGAVPVASKAIVERHGLQVSPATIRNDTAYLEQEGYITRPHHSAGSVPTDKAYRYYVESIVEEIELFPAEQYLIHQIYQEAREELEQWLKTVAAFLARLVHNLVVITTPKATSCRFKHLDLVALQDFMALLIVVLHESRVRQQVLSFNRKVSQDELTKLANKLTSLYAGMTSSEILAKKGNLSAEESQITECIAEMIAAEDKLEYGEPYLEGLRLLLSQPEFANSPRTLSILEVLEGENWLRNIFRQESSKRGVKVVIGEENPDPALQDLSLIASQYGAPDKASGIVGVIGPKRMDYAKAISSLTCLSTLLSNSVVEYI